MKLLCAETWVSREKFMLSKVSQELEDKDYVFCSYVEAKTSFCSFSSWWPAEVGAGWDRWLVENEQ